MNKKWLLSFLLVITVMVIAACGGGGSETQENAQGNGEDAQQQQGNGENGEQQGNGEEGQQQQMPEPDLENVPEVVATVNGEEITKEEFEPTYTSQFQVASLQSQMGGGQEVDQEQLKTTVAESMVGTELLIQEANNRDYTASQEDINATKDELVELYGMQSSEELMTTLQEQGMSEDEINSQLETQSKIDQLIAEEAGDTTPTEEELQQAYDQMVSQQEQMGGDSAETPSFEEVKPMLEEQLSSQKESEATMTIVEDLRSSADVTVNV